MIFPTKCHICNNTLSSYSLTEVMVIHCDGHQHVSFRCNPIKSYISYEMYFKENVFIQAYTKETHKHTDIIKLDSYGEFHYFILQADVFLEPNVISDKFDVNSLFERLQKVKAFS